MNESAKQAPNTNQRKVGMWTSIAFGCTDMMGGGYGALVGAYLMFFFTTFCNLSALKAGSIIGLAKVVDSVTSIVMGRLSDTFWRTKLGRRFGRRHFFLLIGSPLILIVYSLLWIPGVSYAYYLIVYCLVEIVVTMVLIPYETLPSEMTTDFNSRSKMSTTRMFFSGAITSVVTLVGGLYIKAMGQHNPYAYTATGVTFAIIFAVACLITWKFTWERPVEEIQATADPNEAHQNLGQFLWTALKSYVATLKVKAFRQHMYLYLLGVTAQDLFSGAFVYFIVFGYGLSTSTASFLLSLGIIGLPLTPVNYWLFTRLGAKKCYVLYFALVIAGLAAYYIMYMMNLTHAQLIPALIIVTAIYLFFKGGAYSIPWNVFPFIPDVDEMITSKRREGEFAAMMSFIRKLTSGLASVFLGWVLTENGFKTGATVQSAQATHAVVYVLIFGTGILTLAAMFIAVTFNLDAKTHKVLVNEINRLKADGKKADVKPEVKKVVESLTGVKYENCWPAGDVAATTAANNSQNTPTNSSSNDSNGSSAQWLWCLEKKVFSMKIKNPVLPGFNPDPSMIRVGDTYYIANSTFEWFPGVRLHESTDMVHWRLLPSPLSTTTLLNLHGDLSSGGIWAPDLSYHDGKFWLIFTDVKTMEGPFKDCINYLTTADKITGPWSDPIELDGTGFDASLFHDDDGRKYLVQETWDHREWKPTFHGITLTEYDPKAQKLLPKTRRVIYDGTDVALVEGPHLYKINGYYYLFAAQGGTVWTHQEVVARSRTLDAHSFETEPGDIFLTNFDTPRMPIQKQGHGALVNTPAGEWYYASLCGRPWHHENESVFDPRGWCSLGRETAIQKVEFDDDGWPRVVGGHGGLVEVPAPKDAKPMTDVPDNHSFVDQFDQPQLNLEWQTLRDPFDARMGHQGDGQLILRGQQSLSSTFNVSLIAARWQAFHFRAETKVSFDPYTYQQMAGLVNFYNDRHYSWIFITYDEDRDCRVIEVAENNNNHYHSFLRDRAIVIPDDVHAVYFKTVVEKQSYHYAYSFDGHEWHDIDVQLDAAVLSDDYVLQNYGGFFTGAMVGLACVDYSGFYQPATFDFFKYQER